MEINENEIAKSRMQDVINDVYAERERQNIKWGVQDRNPIEWIAILTEEVGETAKEAVDFWFGNSAEIDLQKERLERYRLEMVQVAAVAIQAIECLDRQKQFSKDQHGKYKELDLRIFKHVPTGLIGTFVKEYTPTGHTLTMQIALADGNVYFAPKSEFEQIK